MEFHQSNRFIKKQKVGENVQVILIKSPINLVPHTLIAELECTGRLLVRQPKVKGNNVYFCESQRKCTGISE